MTFNATQWKETLVDIKGKLPSLDPSSGLVCAIASVAYIRDEVLAMPEWNEEKIQAAFQALIKSLVEAKTTGGFASNASQAAKFAELDKAKRPRLTLATFKQSKAS